MRVSNITANQAFKNKWAMHLVQIDVTVYNELV